MKKEFKVKQFYAKNQFILEGENKTIFQSYNSTIAIIKGNTLTLGSDWDYSNTTRKYLYMFLDEYCPRIDGLNGGYLRHELEQIKNKRKYIQKLIDNNTIKYDEVLR